MNIRLLFISLCIALQTFAAPQAAKKCPTSQSPSGIIIIPGISGDLAKRKLIPALYNLLAEGSRLFIVGTGRGEQDINNILEQARPFISNVQESQFTKLKNSCAYKRLDGKNYQDFVALKQFVDATVKQQKLGDLRIMLLSLPPETFSDYTKNSVTSGLIASQNPQHRVIYEKPFGTDSASARNINTEITRYLCEEQIYRNDHYLAKPLIHALPSLRHDNPLLSSAWNNCTIESVHITLNETIDIEGRGAYYDAYGLLKDVVQNHALQLVALIAMNQSGKTYTERSKHKANALAHVCIKDGILGQYTGYRAEKGVNPNTKTETFARLTLCCDLPQWKGVPFYITAGKALSEKKGEIVVAFKGGNQLILKIAPREEILLTLSLNDLCGQKKSIALTGSAKPLGEVDAYQTIISNALNGRKDATVSMLEIMHQWQIIESIQKLNLPFCEYKKGAQESEIII